MDNLSVIVAACLIWLAAIVSPGPNFLVISRLALSRSRPAAVRAAFGIAIASTFYAALTMFGLSSLILRFVWIGDAVRILGGGYLVWLGIQAWRSSNAASTSRPIEIVPDANASRGFWVGILSEITNPKAIGFFLGLFAAAVPATTPLWAKLTVLSVGGGMEIVWYIIVAFALASGSMRAGYQRMQRAVDRIVGTLLIAVGLKVALDRS
jgi:threonine/homoserine/homoserine lactone efflux protein